MIPSYINATTSKRMAEGEAVEFLASLRWIDPVEKPINRKASDLQSCLSLK